MRCAFPDTTVRDEVLFATRLGIRDGREIDFEHLVFSWLARPALWRLKAGTDAALLAYRGVEDVVPAELGLGCLADKAAAEGLFFPEHLTSFGFNVCR